jgi:thiosulfate dehydrogenase (quinone) large subunit
MTETRMSVRLRERDIATAYALLRIVVGVNYFNHGFTRLGDIPGFVNSMVEKFQGSFIPEALVRVGAIPVSPLELVVGLLIAIGLFTRGALIVCFALMVMLMYGVTAIQDWDTATSQLIYCIVLFILLAGNNFNTFAIDSFLRRRRMTTIAGDRSRQPVAKFSHSNR